MPQIIVAADRDAAFGQGAVTLREGVTVADFESDHFATQLVERLGWAVEDADQLERTPGDVERTPGDVERTAGDAVNAAGELEPVPDEPQEVENEDSARDREPVIAR